MFLHCGKRRRVLHTRCCCRIHGGERGPSLTTKECSGTEDCCRIDGGERGPASTAKECSETEDCCQIDERERGARLQHLTDVWQQTIASETYEQTETRRDRDRQYHTPLQAVGPLQLQQQHILRKMTQFHSKLANLQVGRCFTCREAFSRMTVQSVSTSSSLSGCLQYTRDKHCPKLYSSQQTHTTLLIFSVLSTNTQDLAHQSIFTVLSTNT